MTANLLILLFPALLLLPEVTLQAQNSFDLPPWRSAAMDNNRQLYLALANGDLERRSLADPNGEILVYSPVKKARISLMDVTNPLRPFIFYEDLQEYVLLNRFLVETSRYSLNIYTSYAGMLAPALNNQLWMVDMVDFSIRKIDPQIRQTTIRIPLPQVIDRDNSDFSFLREYQNLLFLVDQPSGIYVFDNLGNFLRRIAVSQVKHLGFRNNSLYYQTTHEPLRLFIEDIYTGKTETMSLPYPAETAILEADSMWLLVKDRAVRVEEKHR